MSCIDPLEQQKEYLLRSAAHLTTFAKKQHDRQGRGIVVIGWPAPHFLTLEDLLDQSSYMRGDTLTMAGMDPTDELVRAVRGYDPSRQAIVMCVEMTSKSYNVHVLTAPQGSPSWGSRPTGH